MMSERLQIVCLFGFSPHFPEIASFLESEKIRCIAIFSPRQRHAVESLKIPKSTQKLCIENLNDTLFQNIRIKDHTSLGMSFGSPYIFKQKDIDDFQGQLINSHGAPLPEFKGGGGFSWRILQRDKRGTILMHKVTTNIDEGTCIYRKDFMFTESERIPEDLEKRQLIEESKHLIPWIKQVILSHRKFTDSPSQRNHESREGSYFPRLSSELHGCINWSLDIKDLESFVLAFSRPYPGAYTFIKGVKVHIMDFRIHKECYMHPFTYGLILEKGTHNILVACNGGSILIQNNDLRIESDDARFNSGDRFFTPLPTLQKAIYSRAFFKPNGLVVRDYTSGEWSQSG